MFRKDLIPLLLKTPMSVAQIAKAAGEKPARIANDLEHLFRSLKHTEYQAVIQPAQCRDCGFQFSDAKATKPSKCPKCRSRWISEPLISIREKT
jgi:predicted Zn-ribbon and HTH transcriptional regulator